MSRFFLRVSFLGISLISSSLASTLIIGQPPLTGTGNCDPFGCAHVFGLGTYQQVYASSAFQGPISITSIIFYNSQVSNNGVPDQGSYTLSLSYTSKTPGMLDLMNPANNIGSNSQTFYTGTLPTPVAHSGAARTIAFSGPPYAYDPANGNLLITVVVSAPVDQSPQLYLDQAASTQVTTNAYFGTVNGGPVSGGNTIGGLVTGFSTVQITGPTSLAAGSVGVAYGPVTFSVTGGSGGYTWSALGLPSGLTFSTGGVLSGTPATNSQGSYNPQFTVTDSSLGTASVTLPLVINAGSLTITGPSSLAPGTIGVAYGPVTFTASGGAGGYSWSATGLPSGLSISTAGSLSGTPATGSQGSYNPQFTVTDSAHNTANVTLSLVINTAALSITGPSSLPAGTVGAAYGPIAFTASGGAGGYTWSATGLPNGLSISTAGSLSGTPATGSQGSYNPQFTVMDSSHNTASVTLPLVINLTPLSITGPSSLAPGTAGVSYGPVTFTATGGTGGYTWSATGLPNGLSISAAGSLSGTPATGSQGSYNPQFTVTDSAHDTASVSLPLVINAAPLSITGPSSLAPGTVGVGYGPVTFTASGGTGGYTWSATGLPNGLTISTAGSLSGTPATGSQGSYNPQFTVTDSSHNTANVTLPLVINAAPLSITGPSSLAPGTVGVAYGPVTFTASGGSGGYTWSATGLPNGLTISAAGSLGGTPATGSQGTYNPRFTVMDSSHNTANVTLSLIINSSTGLFSIKSAPKSLQIAPGSSANYTITTTVHSGFNAAIALSASGQPSGATVSFNPSVIPAPGAGSSTMTVTTSSSTANGTYTIAVTGTGGGSTQTTNVSLTIATPSFAITPTPKSVTLAAGASTNISLAAKVFGGFNSAITLSASGQPSGATVSFNPNPIPAPGSGTSTMTVSLASTTPSGTYTITVTGVGQGVTETTQVYVTVPTFSMASSPKSMKIAPGGAATFTITTTIYGGFNAAISLSASGQPSGATVSFSPNPIPAPGSGSSTMTVNTLSSTPAGTYIITVTGTGGGITQTTQVWVIVN